MKTLPAHTIERLDEKHIPALVAIDNLSCYRWDEDFQRDTVHSDAWTEDMLQLALKLDCGGLVLTPEDDPDTIVGYVVYEIHKHVFHLVSLAVHPQFRRQGYGTCLLRALWKKVARADTKRIITVYIREFDRSSQEFFKAHHFRSRLVRSFFDDGEDAIRFTFLDTQKIDEAT